MFNIFHKNNIKYSENRNGIFINISNLNENVVQELEKHIQYIKKQEKQLLDVENKKKKYKKIIENIEISNKINTILSKQFNFPMLSI